MIFKEWAAKVPAICENGLVKKLFEQSEDRKLAANLDEDLAMVLRETRYMVMILEMTNLPKEALDVFAQISFFHESNIKLQNISKWLVITIATPSI